MPTSGTAKRTPSGKNVARLLYNADDNFQYSCSWILDFLDQARAFEDWVLQLASQLNELGDLAKEGKLNERAREEAVVAVRKLNQLAKIISYKEPREAIEIINSRLGSHIRRSKRLLKKSKKKVIQI